MPNYSMTPYDPMTATRKASYDNPYGSLSQYIPSPPVPMPQMFNQTQGAFPASQVNAVSPILAGSNYGAKSGAFDFDAFSGSAWDSVKNVGSSALDAAKGTNWFGGAGDKGMKSMGAANTLLGLFDSLSRYNMGNEQMGLFKDQLATNKQQFALNFGNQAQVMDDQRRALYERDVAEAKLNGRAAPKEFTPLSRG